MFYTRRCCRRIAPGSLSVLPSTAVILGRSARLSERSEFRARPKWRGAQGSPQGQTVGVSFLLNTFLWTSKEKYSVFADGTAIHFNIAVGDAINCYVEKN